MPRRRTIKMPLMAPLPDGVDPMPSASVINGLVYTNGIIGIDPDSGTLPEEPDQQFALAFRNLTELVEAAGASKDAIGLVTVYVPGAEFRRYINDPWLATFPDDLDRPARKTNHVNLPPGVLVQLQAVAVTGARRTEIEIPGLSHRDPLPMGCRVGNMVFSSVIGAEDPVDGKRVDGALAQIQRSFDNTALFMEEAGGSLHNLAHMWVFLSDFGYQSAMVDAWVRAWPEDGQRPSRKTLRYALGGETLMQVQVAGVLGGSRANYEIPGVHHHDPIPMGTRAGNVFYSSGISASDPKGDGLTVVEGLNAQIAQCEANVEAMMKSAGGSLDDILLATVLIQDFDAIPHVQRSWDKLFPSEADRPTLKFIDWRIPGGSHVQYHIVGVIA